MKPCRGLWAAFLLLFIGAGGAACATVAEGSEGPEVSSGKVRSQSLLREIDQLYGAFCFDAGEEADWDAMAGLFAEGATFASPVAEGTNHQGVNADAFMAEFREFIRSSPLGDTGYHERVTNVAMDTYGLIAHTWVTFDGFVPGQKVDRRGVDSIQWVRDADGWKLMSFTTQYESEALPMPRRFTR